MTDLTPTAADAAEAALPFRAKWWAYQRERFPLVGHGVLIAAFSFCAVSLSGVLRGSATWPRWPVVAVAFVTCFGFFLQLRIADEFKDVEEDTRYRPYRPVPRGLITLRELGRLFVLVAAVQLGLALWLDVRLLGLLLVTWTYLALMRKEFFVADWLRRRPVVYMVSHMFIMPLVDLYATSADWLTAQGRPPRGLFPFLLASYCNGIAVEVGRKIRSPGDEEVGVSTYSHLWGRPTAVAVWWAALAATASFGTVVAVRLGVVTAIDGVLLVCLGGSVFVGSRFLSRLRPSSGKWIETATGVWTLALYLSLGLVPHLFRGGGR